MRIVGPCSLPSLHADTNAARYAFWSEAASHLAKELWRAEATGCPPSIRGKERLPFPERVAIHTRHTGLKKMGLCYSC